MSLMTTIASGQDTVFTYQGVLNENGSPVDGLVSADLYTV